MFAETRSGEAEALAREHLDRVRHLRGEASLEFAQGMDLMVEALLVTGKATHEETHRLAAQAVDLKGHLPPSEAPELATSLANLGRVYLLRDEPHAARPPLVRALQIQETARGSQDATLIPTLRSLGNVLLALGDLESAETVYVREGGLIAMHHGEMHMEAAGNAYNTARLMIELGDYGEAERLYEKSARIVEGLKGRDHPRMAWALLGLGNVRDVLGKNTAALEAHQSALAVAVKALPPGHPMVASCWHGIGYSLMKLNDLQGASQAFDKALALGETPEHETMGRTLMLLAKVERGMGRLEQAEGHLERAGTIMDRVGSDYQKLEIRILRARMRSDRGQLVEAAQEMQAARALLADLLPGHPDSIDLGAEVGDLLLRAGRPAAAGEAFREVIQKAEQTIGREYPGYSTALAGLATATARVGRIDEALQIAVDAERLGLDRLRFMVSALPERQALRFAEQRTSTLDLLLTLAASGDDHAAVEAAWDAVIHARAAVLDELALRRRSLAMGDGSAAAEEFAVASRRLANLLVQGHQSENPRSTFFDRVRAARTRREAAEGALARESLQFKRLLEDRDVGLAEIRRSLPAGSALVAFVVHARDEEATRSGVARRSVEGSPPPELVEEYAALVLRGSDPVVRRVPLGDAVQVEALVQAWRSALHAGLDSWSAPDEAAYRRAAGSLRERIWDPVGAVLDDVERVFLVPDGVLYLVSFASLPEGGDRYLVDSRTFHYLSAERELVRRQAETGGGGLLAIGGADYDASSLFASLRRPPNGGQETSAPALFRGSAPACAGFRDQIFERLDGSADEASSVARRWRTAEGDDPGQAVLLLRGAEASERRFKEEARGRRVLHLATHGFFLDGICPAAGPGRRGIGGLTAVERESARSETADNPLVLSGLVLAGANHRAAAGPEEEDGVLTAEEVAALDLTSAEWAVLSACDTGLGEIRPGEGVFGLRRSFHVAGARTLIMSLWPVEEKATAEWMDLLYRARLEDRADTAAAVTKATRAILERRRADGMPTHPVLWGAFVASGDWR